MKMIFETSKGERVERTLSVKWSTEASRDTQAFHNIDVAEEFKVGLSQAIAAELSPQLIHGVLVKFERGVA